MRSKDWLQRQKNDFFVKKAKKEGYLSRAAFKLIEIEKKFKLISKSENILELGSSPGGWSQVICEFNKSSLIHAFDLLDMKYSNNQIRFFKEDVLKYNFDNLENKYDLILSDMAPNTIGHQSTDHLKLISLIEEILLIVEKKMNLNGSFVFKIWEGSQTNNIINNLKSSFKKIINFKPISSRNRSNEKYIIAQGYNI